MVSEMVQPVTILFRYGDVLVCRFAEGKWNSLITNAGALVCEMGGKISHGPMIARRIGIPCVSNFPNSLWDYIEDGDEVVVRGNLGTLEILGKSEIPGKLLQNPPEDDKDIQMTMTQEEFQEKLKLAQTTGKE
jgi:phosphoenolpyruvate-protein kinase (PTS system EI component)